ncbi:MAG TPA: MarR family winged helix-turn-helix transcriptional regulator, partial [Dongiaceae bacterium]
MSKRADEVEPGIDRGTLRDITGCTCLGLRRTTRLVTQIYDRHLTPAALTANQFGLLGYLLGAAMMGVADGLSIGQLADRLGMDPTTLNRNLKPLL